MSWTEEFAVSAADSTQFARLSGDYNPLHVDPVAARRMPFGGTVVHGIHLLLAALERSVSLWALPDHSPASVSATFSNPVRTGDAMRVRAELAGAGRRLRLAGESQGRAAFSAVIELDAGSAEPALPLPDREFPAAAPETAVFPPTRTASSVDLALSRARLAQLFAALAAHGDLGWIADLVATTRIIGMRCPGMDSVYSVCRLQRRATPVPPTGSMTYEVVRSDERFRMVRLRVAGAALEGHLEALFRTRPVEQPPLAVLARAVSPDAFAGQRALVIGGSRGLGELTAKIIAAGGGHVVITYSHGRADAERICAEAEALGLTVSARPLDLTDVRQPDDLPAWLASGQPSHMYYFASPPIAKSPPGGFSDALYRKFAQIYIAAFEAVARRLLAASATGFRVRILYPSSVFLDRSEKGFAEYCAAKAAGEALCAELARDYHATISCPRLPRMRTDQTSGVRDNEVEDALPVMLALLRRLRD